MIAKIQGIQACQSHSRRNVYDVSADGRVTLNGRVVGQLETMPNRRKPEHPLVRAQLADTGECGDWEDMQLRAMNWLIGQVEA